jgi:multidrug efflux pump subunit AcrA (membrane-fusion protein)
MMKWYFVFSIFLMASCRQEPAATDAEVAEVRTPVTTTAISHDTMSDYIELNATASFLLKSYVKANTNGYLVSGTVRLGQVVDRGQLLFTIKTKEAESIGNAVNQLDSSFRFTGANSIRSSGKGFITQLNHVQGDYVLDGEQLAVISDGGSFVFLMDMPYELRPFITDRKPVQVVLPGGEKLDGYVSASMPNVDVNAQTQSIIIKVNAAHPIPENLIAKVRILKRINGKSNTVPRGAVLTGETQSEFWIMKVINDSTAVKVPVRKGMESANQIEILSPALSDSDKILVTGNYGLEDTAKIKIIN